VDPVRDGSHWFVYVNNDPVNWIDLWGLEDIVIWRAIDAKHDTNWKLYDLFVTDSYRQIEETAQKQGMTVKVINGQDATTQNLISSLENNETKRVIILAHGIDSTQTAFADVQNKGVSLQGVNVGSNLKTVDIVTCYANNNHINKGVNLVQSQLGNFSDVRGYNTTNEVIYWNQTNNTIKNLIPESIKTNLDTSTTTPIKTDPITKAIVGSTGSKGENNDITITKKNH
jgi:hypothetical protein